MKILVTGASIVYALPIIRRLGRLGHTLTVADSHPRASGLYSRYTAARWRYPAISQGGEPFVAALIAFLNTNPHDLVVPLFEETLPVALAQDRAPATVRANLGPYRALIDFHDKAAAYRFARGLSVPVPYTAELPLADPAAARFPAFLKVPQSSCGRGVLRVADGAHLAAALATLSADHQLPAAVRPLLQEEIDGESLSVFAFAWNGIPKGILVYRNLCLYPRRGGSGVTRVSVRHAEVERHALTLLRAARWHGPVGFDFLVERGTGRTFFIDANPRLTLGCPLAAQASFDAAAMMVSRGEPADAGIVPAGHSSVTEPMLLSWLGECAAAGPAGWREAARLLLPLLRARPELFDLGDLRSLLAGPAALVDLVRSVRGQLPSGLEMIRHGQYADYSSQPALPARASEGGRQ